MRHPDRPAWRSHLSLVALLIVPVGLVLVQPRQARQHHAEVGQASGWVESAGQEPRPVQVVSVVVTGERVYHDPDGRPNGVIQFDLDGERYVVWVRIPPTR